MILDVTNYLTRVENTTYECSCLPCLRLVGQRRGALAVYRGETQAPEAEFRCIAPVILKNQYIGLISRGCWKNRAGVGNQVPSLSILTTIPTMELESMTAGVTYAPTTETLEDSLACHVPYSDPLGFDSLVPYPNDYWTRAEARKCFTTEQSNVQVTLVDVNSGNDGNYLLLLIDCHVLMSR
jgi:hypothetical protein